VTLEPEQVDSVITVSLQVINSYGRSHTVNRTITVKRDHQSQYFVKDHLGSPRVVVDGKGAVLSHTDYYPFGMVMPDRAANISLANDRVKFTGYLLEEEGGQDTYHAEARGYDPVIGRFTSRDPLTAKMPGWNPYHYSFNNPIRFVDPTGLAPDDYGVDRWGNITLLRDTPDDDDDKLILINRDKTETDKSITVKKGTLENKKNVDGVKGSYTLLELGDDASATELFEFLSNNTNVEWSQVKYGETSNAITSSHDWNTETGGIDVIYNQNKSGNNVREHIHSHPRGTFGPSGFSPDSMLEKPMYDRAYAKWMNTNLPKTKLSVYQVETREYIKFNKHGRVP
jgi:RHS repeat-associated protein